MSSIHWRTYNNALSFGWSQWAVVHSCLVMAWIYASEIMRDYEQPDEVARNKVLYLFLSWWEWEAYCLISWEWLFKNQLVIFEWVILPLWVNRKAISWAEPPHLIVYPSSGSARDHHPHAHMAILMHDVALLLPPPHLWWAIFGVGGCCGSHRVERNYSALQGSPWPPSIQLTWTLQSCLSAC